MSEKEKMLAGMIYDANDKELLAERAKCKAACFEFNKTPPSDLVRQREIMGEILGETRGDAVITAPFWCDYGYNIKIGEKFYANHNCIFLDAAKISFGDNVFIAPNCCFTTAEHPIDPEQRRVGLEFAEPITVGNNVWFGAGVVVLAGVTIGDDVVIGAGSIVTRDIPSGVIAVGNPCRVLREITEADRR